MNPVRRPPAGSSIPTRSGPAVAPLFAGGRGTATRTVGLLGGILSFAVSEGVRSDNPVREVERYAIPQAKSCLTPEQYRALGAVLEEAETDGEN